MTKAKTFGLGVLTAALLLVIAAFQLPAESAAEGELADFAITVVRDAEGVRLTCSRGCAWRELAWSPSDHPQAIDEYGMAGAGKE